MDTRPSGGAQKARSDPTSLHENSPDMGNPLNGAVARGVLPCATPQRKVLTTRDPGTRTMRTERISSALIVARDSENGEALAEAFHIICADRSETSRRHQHITTVGTVAPPAPPRRWAIAEVLDMLALGNTFYTTDAFGDPVFVHRHRCECGFETIRTTDDSASTDGLDSLRICEWPRV